jgi:predicted RNA-binding protein associated with RNAse of E/G family
MAETATPGAPLELDILVDARTGEVEVADEDEFVDVCNRGDIAAGEALAARRAVDRVGRLIRDAREPFSHVGQRKLTEAIALALPPLTTFP